MRRVRADAAKAIQRAIDRASAGPQNRRSGRITIGELDCNLGRVIDLSSGGVRLLSRRKLSGRHEITVFARDGGVRLDAEVKWSKRLGLFKHEIGLEFLNLPTDIAARLTTLAYKNRI